MGGREGRGGEEKGEKKERASYFYLLLHKSVLTLRHYYFTTFDQ
jgi:hypothetical protein